jgi:hypothetical protein
MDTSQMHGIKHMTTVFQATNDRGPTFSDTGMFMRPMMATDLRLSGLTLACASRGSTSMSV